MVKDEKKHKCPLCGYEFTDNEFSCSKCGFSKECRAICCPHCGYSFLKDSRLVNIFKKIFNRRENRTEGKV